MANAAEKIDKNSDAVIDNKNVNDTDNKNEPQNNQQPQPGSLQSVSKITLHTYHAHNAMKGRRPDKEKGITYICGLIDFSKHHLLAYRGAQHLDPFAIYQLIKTEDKLKEVNEHFKKVEAVIQEHKAKVPDGLEIVKPQSKEPVSIEITLAKYGNIGLTMIAHFDNLCLEVSSLIHNNILKTIEGFTIIDELHRNIRSLMSVGSQFKYTGVTQQDLVNRTSKSKVAIETLRNTNFLIKDLWGADDEQIYNYFSQYSEIPDYGPLDVSQALKEKSNEPDNKQDSDNQAKKAL